MKGHVSTSSAAKIKLDITLTSLIHLTMTQYVIMLVGAADGLLRHLENAAEAGADLTKIIILDHNREVIRLLKREFARLSRSFDYPEPQWVVGDLNEFLEAWPANKPIGWLDFDGTSGVNEYHIATMKHAERLKIQYVTVVGCSRVQSPTMSALAITFPRVWRRIYVPKAVQLETRGWASPSFTKWDWCLMTASMVLDELAKAKGWVVLHSRAYKGVSPMSCSLYERAR